MGDFKMNAKKIATASLTLVGLGLVVLGVRAQNNGGNQGNGSVSGDVIVLPDSYYGGPYTSTPFGIRSYYSAEDQNSLQQQRNANNSQNNGARLDIPRANDFFEAKRETNKGLYVRWSGEPRLVMRIFFSLLDRNRKVIQQQIATRQPGEAHLKYMKTAAYYRVQVEYVNGTQNTLTLPY